MLLDEVLALLGRGGVLPVQLFMEGMVEFFLRWICYLAGEFTFLIKKPNATLMIV